MEGVAEPSRDVIELDSSSLIEVAGLGLELPMGGLLDGPMG